VKLAERVCGGSLMRSDVNEWKLLLLITLLMCIWRHALDWSSVDVVDCKAILVHQRVHEGGLELRVESMVGSR